MTGEVRYALRMVEQADDLLDRARDVLGGQPELENETWAILHKALVNTTKLRQQLDLIVTTLDDLEALETVPHGPVMYATDNDPED